MTDRDIERVRFQLVLGAEAATRLARHLDDLHSLAFDRHVGDFEKISGGAAHPPGVETVGDPKARALWQRVCSAATDLDRLAPLERAIGNHFAAGPSPEQTRGAIIVKGEFVAAQRHQRRRRDDGQYTPVRIEDQPGYGGTGR